MGCCVLRRSGGAGKSYSKAIRYVSRVLLILSGLMWLSGCSYMRYVSVQSEYARIQQADPGQINLKHMIDQKNYFVFGITVDATGEHQQQPLLVAAYSDKYKQNERVDSMFLQASGTHYGLNLPSGDYRLLVYRDMDSNGVFEKNEVVAQKSLSLSDDQDDTRVIPHVDFMLAEAQTVVWADEVPGRQVKSFKQSLFYPSGTIRSLDDPLFDRKIATLGMYDPASFLEQAPTMFYALEEDVAYRIPVIFVHGIGDSPRSFEPLLNQLDRERFKPWFFYYPSGGDLNQLAELFYQIFISGKVVPTSPVPMVVVAHSMGGLVVREAINLYQNHQDENQIRLFMSVASPFGGHPAAAMGEKYGPVVLPAWRDLNPDNEFVDHLFRQMPPDFLQHHLLYAFRNSGNIKLGKNSDGVVPIASQLRDEAQAQAFAQYGVNSTHTGILSDSASVGYMLDQINRVEHYYPEDHLKVLVKGGFAVTDPYLSAISRHIFESAGYYLYALVEGEIDPVSDEQSHFIRMIRQQDEPQTLLEKELLRYMLENPQPG